MELEVRKRSGAVKRQDSEGRSSHTRQIFHHHMTTYLTAALLLDPSTCSPVGSVGRAEGVVDVNVSQFGQRRPERVDLLLSGLRLRDTKRRGRGELQQWAWSVFLFTVRHSDRDLNHDSVCLSRTSLKGKFASNFQGETDVLEQRERQHNVRPKNVLCVTTQLTTSTELLHLLLFKCAIRQSTWIKFLLHFYKWRSWQCDCRTEKGQESSWVSVKCQQSAAHFVKTFSP